MTFEVARVKRKPHRDGGREPGGGISKSKSPEVEKGFAYSENGKKTSVPGHLGRKEWSQTGK